MPDKKTITLITPQGVGDVMWCVQKVYKHVDAIRLKIACVPQNGQSSRSKLQTRSKDFLLLLDKVEEVSFCDVSDKEYSFLAHNYIPLAPILKDLNAGSTVEHSYAVNGPLDSGIRIEAIDPELEVKETLPVRIQYCPLLFEVGAYICVYISGSTLDPGVIRDIGVWSVKMWSEFIEGFYKKYALKAPIIIIGAEYDATPALQLESMLRKNGYLCTTYLGAEASNISYILHHSICFIGYQSGLSVLADQLDVKNIMLYFSCMDRLRKAWPKKKNIENNTYNSALFSDSPAKVLSELRLEL